MERETNSISIVIVFEMEVRIIILLDIIINFERVKLDKRKKMENLIRKIRVSKSFIH
jgi:hypothetical protein